MAGNSELYDEETGIFNSFGDGLWLDEEEEESQESDDDFLNENFEEKNTWFTR